MFQRKQKKDKTPETDINKMDIRDLPDKVFKLMAIKMLAQVRRTMHKQRKNVNKEK